MAGLELKRGTAVIASVGVLFGALGWMTGTAVSAGTPSTDLAASPGALAETPGPTTEPEPLRITLAGDSVMAGLAPAVTDALERGGDAEVEFVLTPSVLRDASVRFSWSKELEEFDPDVVVMFVGTWELGEVTNGVGTSSGPNDPNWQTTYETEILDPWIDLVSAQGAEVVWIGAPSVENPDVDLLFIALNETYRALADRHDNVTYVDSTEALAGAGAGYAPVVTTDQGDQVRVRQIDGLHLCPDGAVLLANAVIEDLQERHDVAVPIGWEDDPWRDDEEYPADSCPPPF